MKKIVETLGQKNIIFKSLQMIDPIKLGSKKQIQIYLGTQIDNYYGLILCIERKSPILSKDVQSYIELHQKAQEYNQSRINKRYIFVRAPLCSKAKTKLEAEGWIVFEMNGASE